jgi:hypothetical protein
MGQSLEQYDCVTGFGYRFSLNRALLIGNNSDVLFHSCKLGRPRHML